MSTTYCLHASICQEMGSIEPRKGLNLQRKKRPKAAIGDAGAVFGWVERAVIGAHNRLIQMEVCHGEA